MSNNEYEQQWFWDKPNITPGILDTTFKLTLKKEWVMQFNINNKSELIKLMKQLNIK